MVLQCSEFSSEMKMPTVKKLRTTFIAYLNIEKTRIWWAILLLSKKRNSLNSFYLAFVVSFMWLHWDWLHVASIYIVALLGTTIPYTSSIRFFFLLKEKVFFKEFSPLLLCAKANYPSRQVAKILALLKKFLVVFTH